ncbi:MAG TPA: hypothetical protein GX715_16610 [Armatimonadetes bacterium]|nr:hypothetical protein [Armatimonadota bacterium]
MDQESYCDEAPWVVCDCERLLGILEPGDELPRCAHGVCEFTCRLACWEWARPYVPYPEDRLIDTGTCYDQESTVELAMDPLPVRWQAVLPDGTHIGGDQFPLWPMCPHDAPVSELIAVIRQYCEDTVANLAVYWRKQERWQGCVGDCLRACHLLRGEWHIGRGLQAALNAAVVKLRDAGFPETAAGCLLADASELEARWYAEGRLQVRLLDDMDLAEVKARRACVRSFVTRPTHYGRLLSFGQFRVLSEVVLSDARYTSAGLWANAGKIVAEHARWAAAVFHARDAGPIDARELNKGDGKKPAPCLDADISECLAGRIGRAKLYDIKRKRFVSEKGREPTPKEERRIHATTRAALSYWSKKPS